VNRRDQLREPVRKSFCIDPNADFLSFASEVEEVVGISKRELRLKLRKIAFESCEKRIVSGQNAKFSLGKVVFCGFLDRLGETETDVFLTQWSFSEELRRNRSDSCGCVLLYLILLNSAKPSSSSFGIFVVLLR
jgi:hypothetical protein